MAIKYKNECCDCAASGYPCLGNACTNRFVKYLYCDKCKEDVDSLYIYNGEELCEDCLLKQFETIT